MAYPSFRWLLTVYPYRGEDRVSVMSILDYIPAIWPLVAVIVLSAVVSRALGVSFILTAVLGSVPLGLPAFEEWRLAGRVSSDTPEELMLAGWIIGFLFLICWKLMQPIASALIGKFGIVKIAHGILLLSAVVVSALLVLEPAKIEHYIPFWSTGLGFSLLAATVVSMLLALLRTLRASLFFVVWSLVSIILASELFLHKPLFHLTKRDISEALQVEIDSFDALVVRPRAWIETLVGTFILSSQTGENQPLLSKHKLDVRDISVALEEQSREPTGLTIS